eukprot:Skav231911  [mRNA]  locus=scaffold344:43627:47561:+ [translate_table: standard]
MQLGQILDSPLPWLTWSCFQDDRHPQGGQGLLLLRDFNLFLLVARESHLLESGVATAKMTLTFFARRLIESSFGFLDGFNGLINAVHVIEGKALHFQTPRELFR